MAYLAEAGELYDANGMASTQLAAAVGYPGSSVAFAQLLSGMERSGLIAREVRGKRTTVSALDGPGRRPGAGRPPGWRWRGGSGVPGVSGAGEAGPGAAGFDYDELARDCSSRWSGGWPRPIPRRIRRRHRPRRISRHPARSARPAGDGQRPGVRAGHGVDQARQAGRGERPAAGAAQGRAAVAGARRRAGPPAAGWRGCDDSEVVAPAAAAHPAIGRGQRGRRWRGDARPARRDYASPDRAADRAVNGGCRCASAA